MGQILHSNNRHHVRFQCTGNAEVYLTSDGKPLAAIVADLSLDGALLMLEVEQRIVRGAILELAFSVNNLPFRVRGEVMVARSPTCFGLRFTLLSPRVQYQLTDLIEELTASHLKQAANRAATEKNRHARRAGDK